MTILDFLAVCITIGLIIIAVELEDYWPLGLAFCALILYWVVIKNT
jgi:hypothetical protein